MFKNIIFDYAGVITVGDPGFLWYTEIVPDYSTKKSLFDELGRKVDVGEFTKEQFIQEVSKAANVQPSAVWEGIKSKTVINEEIVSIITDLKKNYTLGLLSNYAHEWLTEVLKEHNLEQYFDEIVISSIEKTVKPNEEIFRIILDRLNAKPEESIFIDDRPNNFSGAEIIGMKTILFTSTEQLRNDLNLLLKKVEKSA